ncbi:MAG: 3-hydroxyacyl-ACP dehydratase FabZ [Oscillospiraceae bacterium]
MNKEEIKNILPHREPMLLVDSSEQINENESLGKYKIKGNEFFLQGHFPNNPVVPGVILCEMMAQSCCILLAEKSKNSTPYFTSLDKVKFKNKVLSGDELVSKCSIIKQKGPFYFCQGKGYVEDTLCVSAEFSFALIENK